MKASSPSSLRGSDGKNEESSVKPQRLTGGDKIMADVERNQGGEAGLQKASVNLAIRNIRRSSSKIVLEKLESDKREQRSNSISHDSVPPVVPSSPSPREGPPLRVTASSPRPDSKEEPGGQGSPRALESDEGTLLFSLPKLCKWFSEQKRPLDMLVKLVTDVRDPKLGVQTTKKLVGLTRVETFPEKDLLQWLVKQKYTAAASTATRIVELLQKDYVICEAKKGLYRFLERDERAKARVEDERLNELKFQKKLAELAKDQKKAAKKKGKAVFPVIGVDLASTLENQRADYPTLEVPFLLVRFAADVVLLNGQKEEGIFRLSIGTEEVAQMVHQINTENNYTLVRKDPNVAAVMMKRYLRDLPQPLCTDYDGALALAKSKASDEEFLKFYELLPACNKAVVRFISNFIFKMTRPEVVLATKMDVNNYAIVFTPGLLRSHAVDLAAMANSQFENEFTVRIVTIVRAQFPDDSVGNPDLVPKPYVAPALANQQELRLLVTDTPELKRPEDLMRQAEERLKNAKRDLHEAKKEAKKVEKKEEKKVTPVSAASLRPARAGSLGKSAGDAAKATTLRESSPTSPLNVVSDAASKIADSASKMAFLARGRKPPSSTSVTEETPPRPVRAPPPLVSPRKEGSTSDITLRSSAPTLPPLPPPVITTTLEPPEPSLYDSVLYDLPPAPPAPDAQNSHFSESDSDPEVSRGDAFMSPAYGRSPYHLGEKSEESSGLSTPSTSPRGGETTTPRAAEETVVSPRTSTIASPAESPRTSISPRPAGVSPIASPRSSLTPLPVSSPRSAVSELRALLEGLRNEVMARNDIGILKGSRTCSAKAMEALDAGAQGQGLEEAVTAINLAVVACIKSEHAPESQARLLELIAAAEALLV